MKILPQEGFIIKQHAKNDGRIANIENINVKRVYVKNVNEKKSGE